MSTKIYFICPTNNFATGGVKQIYRQVETLNANGIEAYVLLKKTTKTEKKWFTTNVPAKYSPFIFKQLKFQNKNKKITFLKRLLLFFLKNISEKIDKDSILVFPEIYGPEIQKIEPEISKVIFNQNCYYTFGYFSIEKDYKISPYNHPKTLATIVASDDAKKYLSYAFPNIKIFQMRLGIDEKTFSFSDAKERIISFMPRKLSDDVSQVINILKQRKNLKDWKLVPIDNKNEKEVAEILQKSAIFLSFNHKEGFGLPPAEAMSCGCYVIGYSGQGGKEYLKSNFSSPVEDGNIIEFVERIEKSVQTFEKNSSDILLKGRMASEFIRKEYNMRNEERDILNIWKNITMGLR
ncbi:MAG: glycosyltransferase family 1 protein [Chryseobacterium sp.]|nr:glycosyltransferase family 1 protein [Chryseobacterium sp.]